MTGPPYPPPNLSSAIGSFVIGESPIGALERFDYWKTIISQYANSPVLVALIDDFSQYVDQAANMEDFYDLIWNIDTAVGYGLDVWGRILGINRVVQVSVPNTYFGFEETGGALAGRIGSFVVGVSAIGVTGRSPSSAQTFGHGTFYNGRPLTSGTTLDDIAYRRLLLAKAMANIADGSVPSLNRILMSLFPGRGNCYVTDDGDMQMTYTFTFEITELERSIVQGSGVMPKPPGVSAAIVSTVT